MPDLVTARLLIRPFVMDDLPAIHQVLDVELAEAETGGSGALNLTERADWLRWSVLNYQQLALLNQPPYGDRAVVLRESGVLIGACGLVPCLAIFELLPGLAERPVPPGAGRATPEMGLYYAIAPAHQGRGYATEAAQALLAYAFRDLNLKRIVATTTYDNAASLGVMRKLGMRIARNPYPEPSWPQVVGFRDNDQASGR